MTPQQKAALLKGWAEELGFQRVGVSRLGPARTGDAYLAWLERGDHATMAYLESRREARLDPRALLPEARSAVCVALDYRPAEEESALWRGVARYARGRDYHNVMTRRLRKLARRVREAFPGAQTKPYVDTGPILERDLAAAAGLGAIGKNTLLLHPEAGSQFMLGELLTSLNLDADPPIGDLCGSCTLCLEACPTGALPEPFRLDSRRCISYWTIEHRGPIPSEVRSDLGEWVFGCDICQEACPHNGDPAAAGDPSFDIPAQRRELDLATLLELGERDYQERFRGSPMKRARRDGLRRNAAIVMGNSGDPAHLPALVSALTDETELVRGHAAWALGELGGEAAARALVEALEQEQSEVVRAELSAALGKTSKEAWNKACRD